MSDVVETIAFGQFQLDLRRRILLADGKPVPLHPRALDVLEFLVTSRDRVVERREIVAHVWRGMAIGDNNLTVQLSALRRALLEHGAEGLIITLPGRGYRFVGDVIDTPPPAAPEALLLPPPPPTPPPPTPRRPATAWLIGLGMILPLLLAGIFAAHRTGAPQAARLSIAVMPFRDLGTQPDERHLADAITDDLPAELRRIPGATVFGRDMTSGIAVQPASARAIGQDLGVHYLLEGSVGVEDETVHISTQLIDTGTGATLESPRFDLPRGKFSEARETIVARIAAALDTELTSLEASRAEHDRPDNPTAIDLFFRARSITDHDDSLQGFDAAQQLLQHALALQPDFADADAELGDMLIRKVQSTADTRPQADLAEAETAIAAALALSPHHAKALAAQAHARYVAGRFTDAAYSAQAALAADPDNAEAQDVLAGCAIATGHLQDATVALEGLIRRNPEGVVARQRLLRLGNLLLLQGRIADATDALNRAIAGDTDPKPGSESWGRAEGAHMLLIAATNLAGHTAEAHAMYEAYDTLWPHRTSWRLWETASKPMAALPGFTRMLAALNDAGMPPHADEHADHHIAPTTSPLPNDAFAPTPLSVPGAETIDTQALAARLAHQQPTHILDLGLCAAIILDATCHTDNTQDDASFLDTVLRHATPDDPATLTVVMADGPYGSASYNAVLRLVAAHLAHVAWYRGGEESWASAGLHAADSRR